jgi:hypothetical protein
MTVALSLSTVPGRLVAQQERPALSRALRHRVTFNPVTPPTGPLQSIAKAAAVDVVGESPSVLGPPSAAVGGSIHPHCPTCPRIAPRSLPSIGVHVSDSGSQ